MNQLKVFDRSFFISKNFVLAGVDEAGRGPLAGPVIAASVVFDKNTFIKEVNDSKRVSEKKREELYTKIINEAITFGVGIVDEKTIDKINILQATMIAMKDAVKNLKINPNLVIVDGNKAFETTLETKTIVKGDSISFSIAAASIVAKVTRDRIMRRASEIFPEYRWNKNKGYGTQEHINAIKRFGPTSIHRMSFLKNIIE